MKGNRGGRDIQILEEDAGELHQVQYDGGGFIPQDTHGANPWHMLPPDKGGIGGRGRDKNIHGVITQGVSGGEVSSARVSSSIAQRRKITQALHVPPLLIQGGDGTKGAETSPPPCDLCGMHMSEGCIISHQRTARCNKNTYMRWRRRYVAIADRQSEATFSLTGQEEAECIEGVEVFKYLGLLLDRLDGNWIEVLRNTWK